MLRARYEQIRQRALERTAMAMGSSVVIRQGMRSWMEGSWEEVAAVTPVFQPGSAPADPSFPQIVALWASVLVGQAERSCRGQRQA